MRSRIVLLLGALLWNMIGLSGQSSPKDTIFPVPPPKSFESTHEGYFGSAKIPYSACAEENVMTNEKGDTVAFIWSVAYLRTNADKNKNRPVTFVFNGGPGSASVWLHMDLLGPKIVQVPGKAEADDGAPPYPIVDNPYCILHITDLVFIDPVGTVISIS